MKKAAFYLAILTLLPALTQSQNSWVTVKLRAAGFSVQMPGKPITLPARTFESATGKGRVQGVAMRTDSEVFFASALECLDSPRPKRPQSLLREYGAAFLHSAGAFPQQERAIRLNKAEGSEIIATMPDGGTLCMRTFAVRNRIYQIAAATHGSARLSADAKRFLNSLRLH